MNGDLDRRQASVRMSDRIVEELAYLLSRPQKKARQRRVLNALDDVCPKWELVARHPHMLAWLQEPHPKTGAKWGDALVDISKEYDGTNLAILFHVAEGTLEGRRPRRGTWLAHGRYMAGERLARHYEVIDLLGSGSFGDVLLVYSHEVNMRQFYAMKVLRPGRGVDATTLARFAKEAYVLMGIRPHPCLNLTTMVERLPDGGLALLSEFVPPDANGGQHWPMRCCPVNSHLNANRASSSNAAPDYRLPIRMG